VREDPDTGVRARAGLCQTGNGQTKGRVIPDLCYSWEQRSLMSQ